MEDKTLMETPIDDMTVGDALKVNALALAATAAVAAVFIGGAYAVETIAEKRRQNKIAKMLEEEQNK